MKGQFRNDSFNGQGKLQHSSGMMYEGLWINGKPADMASKLVILNATPIENEQGTYFQVEVECRNDIDTPTQGENTCSTCTCTVNVNVALLLDQGRRLQISAGFQNVRPEKVGSMKSASKSSATVRSAVLFDVIETMEQHTVDTPLCVHRMHWSFSMFEQVAFLQWLCHGFVSTH